MHFFRLLLPVLALFTLGFADRPPGITVRFFAEGNARDTSSFTTPIKLGSPPHDAFLEKVPAIHERMIHAIYAFPAGDGSWGCTFKLDNEGRIALEVVSTERRGTILVGFISTKQGNHRFVDLFIDQTIRDGILSVPRGLTDLEIDVLRHQFKVLGGGTGPKPNIKYRMWNPFRKEEPKPELPPHSGARVVE